MPLSAEQARQKREQTERIIQLCKQGKTAAEIAQVIGRKPKSVGEMLTALRDEGRL